MSLDITLTQKGALVKENTSGIFVREGGQTVEISEAEWNRRFPDRQPVSLPAEEYETDDVFDANITHNLGRMAEVAGIYQHVWRPEELGITTASQLIEPLREGIAKMKADPETFQKHDASNGWGTYQQFLPWLERYLEACEQYPNATITADR